MLRTFTLDTNCLIDIEENRPSAPAVRMLADAHAAGTADVAVIAISASENPKNGHDLRDFAEFQGRLAALHLAHLKIVLPMMYWDISFWDHCFWADDAMLALERHIHAILIPNEQFQWDDHCLDKGIAPHQAFPWDRGGITNVMFKRSGAIYMPNGMCSSPTMVIFIAKMPR